jgi:hypothetical protein
MAAMIEYVSHLSIKPALQAGKLEWQCDILRPIHISRHPELTHILQK